MIRFRFPVVAALSGVAFVACVADAPHEVSTGEVSSTSARADSAVPLSTTVSSAPPGAASGGTSNASPDKPWSETWLYRWTS